MLKAGTEAGASNGEWTETDNAMRNYCDHLLKLCEFSIVAAQEGWHEANQILDLVVEPVRMTYILLLAGVVNERRDFNDVQDPLFLAALYAVKLRSGRTHPEDIVLWHRLEESDAKQSVARFSGALSEVVGKKNGDLPTSIRLRSTLFFRVLNRRWPTCTEIEDMSKVSGGETTWLRFRKQHGIDWLEKGKRGRKKGGANSTDNLKGGGN
jgi:hypothetical protein